ncbi:MAG: DUF2939 domain-containing protein [Alphaproteobacteria bacterium]|nr:DUF2939 domain-containing protein [Alphaproteobacteria bacterium]
MPTPMVVLEPRPDKLKARPEPMDKPKVGKPRRILRAIGWLVAAALLWCGWAGYALYDLANALDREDAVALARRIDWVAVRDGLREDLRATSAAPGAAAMSDRAVDTLAGTRSVVHLLRNARFTDTGWETAASAAASGRPERGFQWFRIRYVFFSGGPFALRVDIRPDSDSVRQPLVMLMRWSADWRLERVFLPSDSRFGTAPPPQRQAAAAAPAQPGAPPAPAPASGPAELKAILYEEDATDPNGKSYTGTVTWRTVQAPPAQGQPAEPEVRAEIDMPGRPLKMTVAIRRNADRNLPASHIVDVKIEVPADSTTGGIQEVPGIMMKTDEDARSIALSGVSVKVSPDFYMIGLSAADDNVRLNVDMLRQRPWFDVPIRYNNAKRAILSFQKGNAGAKAIEAALASWSNAAANAAKK